MRTIRVAAREGGRGLRGVRRGAVLSLATIGLALAACRRGDQAAGAQPGGSAAPATVATPSAGAVDALKQIDALVGAGKLDEAEKVLGDWTQREPNVVELELALGLVVEQSRGFAAALPLLERAYAMNPRNLPTLMALARGYDGAGQAALSERYAGEALAIDPRAGPAAAIVGRGLVNKGDYDDAIAVLERAQGSGRADVFSLLGRAFGRKSDDAQAEKWYRRALDIDPRNLEAMLNLGQLLVRTGRAAEGQPLLDRHKELSAAADQLQFAEQSSQVSGATSTNFLMLAEQRRLQGDLAGAEDAFRKAAGRDPKDAKPLIGLATVAMQRHANDQALTFARQAVALDGAQPLAQLLLGLAQVRAGQTDVAQQSFERSKRLAPWQAREWDMLGQAYFDAQRIDSAIIAYEEALKLAPNDGLLSLRLGFLHFHKGDLRNARTVLSNAVKAHADSGDLALALALVLDQLADPEAPAMLNEAVARYARAGSGAGTPEQQAARFREFKGAEAALGRFIELSHAASGAPKP